MEAESVTDPSYNPFLDPDLNDDLDDDGEINVEWYPLPDYLTREEDEAEDADRESLSGDGDDPAEGGDPAPFAREAAGPFPTASDYARHHRFAAEPDLPDWLARMVVEAAAAMRAMQRASVSSDRGLDGAAEAFADARQRIRDAIADPMIASDLEARAQVLAQVRRAAGSELADEVAAVDHALAGTVPRVKFHEAIEDIIRREPALAKSAEAVADLYRKGPVFALAKSVEMNITREVQGIIRDHLDSGKATEISIREIMAKSEDFTRSYADTVVRTNANTAATEGRFAQVRDPDVRRIVPAFKFVAVVDYDVRRGRPEDHGENHRAAHGAIAGVDDPIWLRIAPPAGYGCRCSVVMVTKYELRRLGLLREDGGVTRRLSPGIEAFRRHPNFQRSRMPGT